LEYIADSQGIHLRPSESPAAPITNEAKPASSEPSP
jgi:hypothetical protein